jgi:flagellar protein FliL
MATKTKPKAKAKTKNAEPEPEIEDEDIDAEDEAEGGAAKPARKFPLKLILIAVAVLIVLGGGGAAAYFFLGHAGSTKHAANAVKPAVFFDLPDVMVNLSTVGTDRTQYLKAKVVLELPDAALRDRIKPVMPRIMDAFQTYMRELRPTDLDGSAGLYRLKEELTRRVNAAIAPNRINAVLFKEIVVQ